MPKKSKRMSVYSVRVEVGGTTKILTLRVGGDFTELSLANNGKVTEIVREEAGEILLEKFE